MYVYSDFTCYVRYLFNSSIAYMSCGYGSLIELWAPVQQFFLDSTLILDMMMKSPLFISHSMRYTGWSISSLAGLRGFGIPLLPLQILCILSSKWNLDGHTFTSFSFEWWLDRNLQYKIKRSSYVSFNFFFFL